MLLLRKYIRLCLTEVAVTATAAASQGLALVVVDDRTYVLCDRAAFVEAVSRRGSQSVAFSGMTGRDIADMAQHVLASGAVVGSLYLAEPTTQGFRPIGTVVARQGYGPLLYDIVLSRGWVMPDRNEVSYFANRVWKRYSERDDVETAPVDGKLTHSERARPWLDFAYRLRVPVNVAALERNGAALIDDLVALGMDVDIALRLVDAVDSRAFRMRSYVRKDER